MGQDSGIEWTHHTFNPWRGCTKATFAGPDGKTQLHPGCLNCYAEQDMSVKLHGIKWGKGQARVPKAESGWKEPLAWARKAAKAGERHRVFCASLADVLDDKGPPEMRERLWDTIRKTAVFFGPRTRCADVSGHVHHSECRKAGPACGLDWLLLTKRPENWRTIPEDVRPLVWLGTSVSDQQSANEWVPRLLTAEGFRYRFLSVEPLVGPVDLGPFFDPVGKFCCGGEPEFCRCLDGWARTAGGLNYVRPDWVIVGGESGPKARPCNVEWIRDVVRQCAEAGVPCFVKQLGANPIMEPGPISWPHTDPKGGDWDEWPEDLRVRQFPEGR